jgi:hypothetical protein
MSWFRKRNDRESSTDSVQEDVLIDELVERNGLYYKKFTDEPFSGRINRGSLQGTFRSGLQEEDWTCYHDNGQPKWRGRFFAGQKSGEFTLYDLNGKSDSNEYHVSVREVMTIDWAVGHYVQEDVSKYVDLLHESYLKAKKYLDEIKPHWSRLDESEKEEQLNEIWRNTPGRGDSEEIMASYPIIEKMEKFLKSNKCKNKYNYTCENKGLIGAAFKAMVKRSQYRQAEGVYEELRKYSVVDLGGTRQYLDRKDS